MEKECRPPDGTANKTWHELRDDQDRAVVALWNADLECWRSIGLYFRSADLTKEGWRYVGPIAFSADIETLQAEIEQLKTENKQLSLDREGSFW